MSRNEYHSYYGVMRKDKRGNFVRIIDRYYPGMPGPEYSGILDLDPGDALELGRTLIEVATRAHNENTGADLKKKIMEQVVSTASNAKQEAME